jgi:hypothetical protein
MTIEPTSQTKIESDPPIATPPPADSSVGIGRSTREKRPSFKLRTAFSARVQALLELISYREAIKHPYSNRWTKAVKEEIEALDRNKTWDLVDEDTTLMSGKRDNWLQVGLQTETQPRWESPFQGSPCNSRL